MVLVLHALPCRADDDRVIGPKMPAPPAASAPTSDFFSEWSARVQQAQASQPHWITPLVTVTPRLEQEVRYDQSFQQLNNGAHVANYDGGKGLELIPTTTNEVIFNAPPFLDRTYARSKSTVGTGFSDTPVLLVKQRLLSAPESEGNYILTAFLGVSAPTAAERFTPHADPWIVTPTIAGGKGWGNFNVQATFGVQIPVSYENENGRALQTNVAFQEHVGEYFWPEFEINNTYWTDGPRGGRIQTFLTPGIIFGRFVLVGSAKAIFGVGYQFAVTPSPANLSPITPTYDRALLATARVTF